jgi:hypothetical protein
MAMPADAAGGQAVTCGKDALRVCEAHTSSK